MGLKKILGPKFFFSFSGVWILCVCVQPDLAPTPASDARELPDYHSDHCEEGKDDEESE